MIGAADLEVVRGNGIVGGGDIRVEVSLGDILCEGLAFLFQQSVWVWFDSRIGKSLYFYRGL